jgi:hypothetical protein
LKDQAGLPVSRLPAPYRTGTLLEFSSGPFCAIGSLAALSAAGYVIAVAFVAKINLRDSLALKINGQDRSRVGA